MNQKIQLQTNDDGDIAYLILPKHPGKGSAGAVAKVIPIHEIIANYQGPEVFLDFDKNGMMIGIEVLLD
ncbi:MAG: DUF2283 domain-containing protein [Hafnia alvei]|nr:DUF2283 domain-containing protein [Hafnia alvei]